MHDVTFLLFYNKAQSLSEHPEGECGALQLCLPYLDETMGAPTEAQDEFNKEACLL